MRRRFPSTNRPTHEPDSALPLHNIIELFLQGRSNCARFPSLPIWRIGKLRRFYKRLHPFIPIFFAGGAEHECVFAFANR